MGLSAEKLQEALTVLAEREPAFAEALIRVGYPEPRIRPRGYETLLRTIVGQQVSVQAANSIWGKLDALIGGAAAPENMVRADDDLLRSAGLSRQKIGYARSLAEEVASGRINLAALPEEDEAAVAVLTGIKGIGRWSAEIYLLFAEGRPDIWPAGDLAVQIEIGRMMGLEARPTEKAARLLADAWRPHRGAAAIFSWHAYGHRQRAGADKLPV